MVVTQIDPSDELNLLLQVPFMKHVLGVLLLEET